MVGYAGPSLLVLAPRQGENVNEEGASVQIQAEEEEGKRSRIIANVNLDGVLVLTRLACRRRGR